MKICVLASGSKGNCSYIETNHTKSLVDLGMSAAYISKSLKKIGVDPATFYRKKVGESDFYRREIQALRKILNLSSKEVDSIFFDD